MRSIAGTGPGRRSFEVALCDALGTGLRRAADSRATAQPGSGAVPAGRCHRAPHGIRPLNPALYTLGRLCRGFRSPRPAWTVPNTRVGQTRIAFFWLRATALPCLTKRIRDETDGPAAVGWADDYPPRLGLGEWGASATKVLMIGQGAAESPAVYALVKESELCNERGG